MGSRKANVIAILLPLFIGSSTFARQTDIRFKHLTTEDGLPGPTVRGIVQDEQGFLWFGTNAGLARYDGYQFTTFYHDPFDTNTIASSSIWSLFKDSDGLLWIGEKGLSRYNPVTGSIRRFQHDPGNPNSISGNNLLWSINEDRLGNLWIVSFVNGLSRLDRTTGKATRYYHNPDDDNSLGSDRVYTTVEDPDSYQSIIWVGTTMGLDKLDYHTGTFTHYRHDPAIIQFESHNWFRDLVFTEENDLWIATNVGLEKFNRSAETFIHYRHTPVDTAKLEYDALRKIYRDQRDFVWLGVEDGSLLRFKSRDLQQNDEIAIVRSSGHEHLVVNDLATEVFRHDPYDPSSLGQGEYITSIIEDRDGTMWFGFVNGGVSYVEKRYKKFHLYCPVLANTGLSGPYKVMSITEDNHGNLWLGTWGEGLWKLDRATNSYTAFKPDDEKLHKLHSSKVQALYYNAQIDSNILWLGMYLDGWYKYDLLRDEFYQCYADNTVLDIMADADGNLWLATEHNGLARYDPDNESITHYRWDLDHPKANNASCIVSDPYRDNILWVYTNLGLLMFDIYQGTFETIPLTEQDGYSAGHDLAAMQNPEYAWLLSSIGDLYRFKFQSKSLTREMSLQGISRDKTKPVLMDDSGMIWAGSHQGLLRINPGDQSYRIFTVDDGFADNLFSTAQFESHRTGELFFGGNKGIVTFHPDSILDNPNIPPIHLTSFKILNAEAEFDTLIGYKKHVILSHDQNVFSIEYAALSYINPTQNLYAHQLVGFDKDWIYQDALNRTATYTNLNPGKYVFRVKGSNNDGVWNEAGASIQLSILPPWWRTSWAYGLYGLLFFATLYGAYRFQSNRIRLRQELEMKDFETRKLQEIDELKSRFFANISHEFRTPLNLILGPINSMLERARGDRNKAELGMIRRNARRLSHLINQLLDLSKMETGKITLQAGPVNMVKMVASTTQLFGSMADQKQIELAFHSPEDVVEVYLDREKMDKILSNLLSNALKFTPEGGRVDVAVSTTGNGFAEVTVTDTGIGIPPDQLDRIFDRFYQVDSSSIREWEGTGIGLALTRELIELHQGRITVISEAGKGSRFTVLLPLGRDHLSEHEIVTAPTQPEAKARDIGVTDIEHLAQTVSAEAEGLTPTTDKTAPVILVVEDNADMRTHLRDVLGQGYSIIAARDGADGLEQAVVNVPDLIISDVMMPNMDGMELCHKLKTDVRISHIPVILLTAKAGMENKLEGLETGADDYINKPFEAQELQVRVKNLISQRRMLRERFSRNASLKPRDITVTSIDERFLQRALDVVEEHMSDEHFDVATFSSSVGMSRANLNRKLKAITAQSATGFIRTLRLFRAAQLLEQNFGDVTQVAYEVGFTNPSYFGQCFRKQFGQSPSQYPPASKA